MKMLFDDERMLRILYSPMLYTNKSHIPKSLLAICNQTNDIIINYWLLNKYNLLDLPENWSPSSIATQMVINNWEQLSEISYLVGGYLLRSYLLTKIKLLMVDPRLLSFISLPLFHQISIKMDAQINKMDLFIYGGAFILNLAQDLHAALQQRFLLCLPVNLLLPEMEVTNTPNNINLLKVAIHYAKNYCSRAA